MANIRLVAACGGRYYIDWALPEVGSHRPDVLVRSTIIANTMAGMVRDYITRSMLRACYSERHADVSNTGEFFLDNRSTI
jgi:hypothetical protein